VDLSVLIFDLLPYRNAKIKEEAIAYLKAVASLFLI
jgi:hypothetical protein